MGYNPWGHRVSDMTERLTLSLFTQSPPLGEMKLRDDQSIGHVFIPFDKIAIIFP